jgi:molybdopterin-containing oxidoreductase family membrane subunit
MVAVERRSTERQRQVPIRPPGGAGYWLVVVILAVLAVSAVVALVMRTLDHSVSHSAWAYTAAAFAFLLGAAQGAPVLALISRLGHGYWGIPLHRAAELLGLAGLVTAPLALVLLAQLPPSDERPSIWFGWPGAPLLWDGVAVVSLATTGLAAIVLAARPDEALLGRTVQHGPIRWIGSTRQWRVISAGVVLVGAIYAMLYALVQVVVASDLALGLVPGWRSAILPAYLGITGLQAGLAATVLVAAGLRRFEQWRPAIDAAAFEASGKLLLAFALLWFYFWWSEFLTYWYGRTPEERWLLGLLMFGPYLGPFLAAFVLSFVLPTALLIWNPVRNNIAGVTLAAGLTLLGALFDRVRLFVAAWTELPASPDHPSSGRFVPPPGAAELAPLPSTLWPAPFDLLILVGSVSAVGLLFLLVLRLAPPVSIWEQRWAARLVVERRLLDAEVDVVGRPS